MAGETKWTPGPWVVDELPRAEPSERILILSEAKDAVGVHSWIATVNGYARTENWAGCGGDPAANARLIAAAPALYEALEKLEAASERLAATRSQQTYDAMLASGQSEDLLTLDGARRNARAALSSARGE